MVGNTCPAQADELSTPYDLFAASAKKKISLFLAQGHCNEHSTEMHMGFSPKNLLLGVVIYEISLFCQQKVPALWLQQPLHRGQQSNRLDFVKQRDCFLKTFRSLTLLRCISKRWLKLDSGFRGFQSGLMDQDMDTHAVQWHRALFCRELTLQAKYSSADIAVPYRKSQGEPGRF